MESSTHKRKVEGVLFILAAALIWAIEPILVRYSCKQGSTILQILTTRAIVASAVAFGYLIFRKANLRPTKTEFLSTLYIALVASIFADYCFLFALTQTRIVNALLIAHVQPIFIVTLGFFFLHDKLTKFDYAGGVLMIIAGIMVSSGSLENIMSLKLGNFGDLLVLMASFAWATTSIAARKYLVASEAALVTAFRFGIAGMCLLAILLARHGAFTPSLLQICLGVIIGIGYIFYMEGIKRIKAAQAASLELSSILYGAVIGYTIFSEAITSFGFIGIIIMLCGVYLISKKEEMT